jgi:hypothetical protein
VHREWRVHRMPSQLSSPGRAGRQGEREKEREKERERERKRERQRERERERERERARAWRMFALLPSLNKSTTSTLAPGYGAAPRQQGDRHAPTTTTTTRATTTTTTNYSEDPQTQRAGSVGKGASTQHTVMHATVPFSVAPWAQPPPPQPTHPYVWGVPQQLLVQKLSVSPCNLTSQMLVACYRQMHPSCRHFLQTCRGLRPRSQVTCPVP